MKRFLISLISVSLLLSCEKEETVESVEKASSVEPPKIEVPLANPKNKLEVTDHKLAALKKTELHNKARDAKLAVGRDGLTGLLPDQIDGIAAKKGTLTKQPSGLRHTNASYMDTANKRSININLQVGAQMKPPGIKPGEEKKLPQSKLEIKGFDVDGFTVERVYYTSGSEQSEVNVKFQGKLDVQLSVVPAKDKDESLELLKTLDLNAFDNYAKTIQ